VGCAPSPEFFFHFGPQNGQFRCIVGAGVGCIPIPTSGSAAEGPASIQGQACISTIKSNDLFSRSGLHSRHVLYSRIYGSRIIIPSVADGFKAISCPRQRATAKNKGAYSVTL